MEKDGACEIDKIKNAVVLDRMGEGRIMLELIKKRKSNWLGHWLRWNCLLKDALEQGSSTRGPRATCGPPVSFGRPGKFLIRDGFLMNVHINQTV